MILSIVICPATRASLLVLYNFHANLLTIPFPKFDSFEHFPLYRFQNDSSYRHLFSKSVKLKQTTY